MAITYKKLKKFMEKKKRSIGILISQGHYCQIEEKKLTKIKQRLFVFYFFIF